MCNYFRHTLFCIFLFCFTQSLIAQQKNVAIVLLKVDEQNGLSDNNVQCVFKDNLKRVWIGTAAGLNLMDGSDITIYKNQPANPYSISDNFITSIAGDKSGFLWIGTHNGLNRLNINTGLFNKIILPGSNDVKGGNISSLAVDKKNNVYIGTYNGLYFLNSSNGKTQRFTVPGKAADINLNNRILNIIIDSKGKVWFTTYNGLWSYEPLTALFSQEISDQNDKDFTPLFTSVIESHSGVIWAGTWDKGLKEFDPVSKTLTTHTVEDNFAITTLAEIRQADGKYILWLNGALKIFDPEENKIKTLELPLGFSAAPVVENLYASEDNGLWMGTQNGLYFYNASKKYFTQHRFPKAITGQSVAVLETDNKIFVSGSGQNFLKAYDAELNETDVYRIKTAKADIACLSLSKAAPGFLKAGTSNGIADINMATQEVRLNTMQFLTKKSASGNFITTLLKDDEKGWWIFPWRNGIWFTDGDYTDTHQLFNNFIMQNDVPKPLVIMNACKDKNENIWMADVDEGIVFYNRKDKRFSKPFSQQLNEKLHVQQVVNYKQNCYTFSAAAIYHWNVDSMQIHKIPMPVQMDKNIVSIAFDSTGILWLATQKGLYAYNLQTKIFEHFSAADGLINNNMDGTLYCRKNGSMLFAGPLYISAFNPAVLLQDFDKSPTLLLEQITANGKIILPDTTAVLLFDHDVNNFIFKWAVTDYNNPLNNHYYYRLQGIDKDWRYAGTHGMVEYASLSAGNYILQLKGENSNGIHATGIITIRFEVRQPWWRSWWFFSLLVISLAGIFYGVYRYRLRYLLKIEKIRNKISLDLHDDIGSTLSSISILSEMALRQAGKLNNKEMLTEIKENTLSLMERMDDIVWSINPQKDSIESLFLRIKIFAAKLFEAKEINYSIDIAPHISKIHLPMEYRQHIYLILKEAINNLVKYSCCSHASIVISIENTQLKIQLKDDGIGFDTALTPAGNGLLSMKKRAAEMKGSLEIYSSVGNGTNIQLSVKIK